MWFSFILNATAGVFERIFIYYLCLSILVTVFDSFFAVEGAMIMRIFYYFYFLIALYFSCVFLCSILAKLYHYFVVPA